MDKTLYELVPVSVKPEKEGWYDLIDPEGDLKAGSYYFKSDCWWEDENYTADEDFTVEHMFYLRPLPPPVAEERTEKMWLDIVHSVFAGYELMKMPIEVAEELKKRFHITKK